jgi:hypothetical protein
LAQLQQCVVQLNSHPIQTSTASRTLLWNVLLQWQVWEFMFQAVCCGGAEVLHIHLPPNHAAMGQVNLLFTALFTEG